MSAQNSTAPIRFLLTSLLCAQMALPLQLVAQQPTPMPQNAPASAPNNMQTDGAYNAMTVEPPTPPAELPIQRVILKAKPTTQPLPMNQRYQLVLDRFTYGPRPGDLEHIKQIGFNKWFEQQLNPWRTDNSVLDTKLAQYPAMNMPLYKLMELFPDNNMLKRAAEGKVTAPGGDAAHAIYRDNEERYKDKKANKNKTPDPSSEVVDVVPLPKTPAEVLALPPTDRFKAICHMTLTQFRELRKELTPEQRPQLTEGFAPAQVEAIAAFSNPKAVIEAEDIQTKLLRDVYSEHQLEEVMVDFWLNHFNVYMKKSQQAPYYIAAYDRESIRPYALGHFEDLLIATATSPAMLNYLDASESVGPHSESVIGFDRRHGNQQNKKASGLNENYAREVMELHTIGVNGGYTQKDVTELAKVFTGWTVGRQRGMDVAAQSQYDPTKHEPGDKVVMGRKIKSNNEKEGYEALKMLAESPQCARFISTKLAVRFVGDNPPPAMIENMVATFQETRGDIRRVLIAMVNSADFFTTGTYRAKVKTPQDFVVSAVRAAGSDVESTAGLASAIADLGMPLFGMQTPNGYSMKTEAWNSTTALVSRMNFAMALATNRVQGVTTNFEKLLGPQAASMTPEQKTAALEARLLEVPVSSHTEQAILKQTGLDPSQQKAELKQIASVRGKNDPLQQAMQGAQGRKDEAFSGLDTQASVATGLILGSPEFQRR